MNSQIPSPNSSFSQEHAATVDSSSSPGPASDSFISSRGSPSRPDGGVPLRVEAEETERHPKGRRKRTAAKDKAILEAAYTANPKPDKTARLDIVKRVSMTEKEVQIWFQNRRQNDRRKSRPLSPYEVAAIQSGGMQILSKKPVSFGGPSDVPGASTAAIDSAATHASDTPLASPDIGPWLDGRCPGMSELLNSSGPLHDAQAPEMAAPPPASSDERRSFLPEDTADNNAHFGSSQTFSFSCPSSASGGGHAASHRWSVGSSFSSATCSSSSPQQQAADESSSRTEAAFDPLSSISSTGSATATAPVLPPPLPQSSSGVRLRLSLEGSASLVSLLGSPSPPRGHHHPPPMVDVDSTTPIAIPALKRLSFNRSRSAVTLPPLSALTGSLTNSGGPPRLTRGRSRDTLAWEFACDSAAADRREDELTAQAEREASGSAAAAISLLRTASSSSSSTPQTTSAASPASGSSGVLQPNGSKRNAPMSSSSRSSYLAASSSSQQQPHNKRAKLGRATSSVARLQTAVSSATSRFNVERLINHHNIEPIKRPTTTTDDSRKKMDVATLVTTTSGGNDSDKENWSPDEDGNPVQNPFASSRRHPLPGTASAAAAAAATRRGLFGRSNTAPPASLLGLVGGGRAGGAGREKRTAAGAATTASSIDIFEDEEHQRREEDDEYRRRDGGGGGEQQQQEQVLRAGRSGGGNGNLLFPAGGASGGGRGNSSEVERFMRGEVSPGKKGDLDCVAGLLSLSQGNWR